MSKIEAKDAKCSKVKVLECADAIKCPHCEKLNGYDDYLEVGDMSGEFEMDCEHCGGHFNVDFYSVFYFLTKK